LSDRRVYTGIYIKFFDINIMVYELGDRGADLLAERYGGDRRKISWQEKNRKARRSEGVRYRELSGLDHHEERGADEESR